MQTGWVNDNGTWYYTNASGAMQTGWINDNGTWYYTNASGAMQIGWINDNGTWYYTNTSGAMQTGWINDNGIWYYTNASGAMQTGTIIDSGKMYTLNVNGAWDGKAGVSVSSSLPRVSSSSSSGRSNGKVSGDGWYGYKSNGNIVVTGLEEGVELTQAVVEAKGIKKINNVTISDTVGEGEVTLEGLEINGNLNVNGGGSKSIRLKNCTIKKNVVANKSDSVVHISFGKGTEVGGEIEAKGKEVIISIQNPVMVIKAIIAKVPVIVSGVSGAKVEVFTIAKEEIKVEIGVAVDKVETGANVDAKEIEIVVDPDVEKNVKLDKDIVDSGKVTNEEVITPDVEEDDNKTEDPIPEKPGKSNLTVSGAAVNVNVENNTGSATITVTGSAIDLKLDPSAITGNTYNDKKGTFTLASELPPLLNVGENSIMVNFKAEDTTEVTTITITLTINTNNTNQTTGWQQIGSDWYYFDDNGVMLTGWQKIHEKWYYLGDNGVMQTGWQQIHGKWYYLGEDGVMQTGWQQIHEKWYYLGEDGVMLTGWQKIHEKWYYLGDNGVMLTGWQKIHEKWYYFDNSGVMLTDTYIDGYYIDSDGICSSK